MTDNDDPEYIYTVGMRHIDAGELAEGAECLRRAADMGYLPARRDLGIAYLNGVGVEKDPLKAYPLIKEAADSMDPNGMYHLALMYEAGEGVPKDLHEALKLMAFAAGANLRDAARDADRIEAEIDAQRKEKLYARPILNLEVSDVDVEAACCKKMLEAMVAGDVYVEDTYKGPMLIYADETGENPITKCPFCGKAARRVERNKRYRWPSAPAAAQRWTGGTPSAASAGSASAARSLPRRHREASSSSGCRCRSSSEAGSGRTSPRRRRPCGSWPRSSRRSPWSSISGSARGDPAQKRINP